MTRAARNLHNILLVILVTCIPPAIADRVSPGEALTIDDYFKLKSVVELALSSDGEMFAYIVERRSLDENRPVRTVYISRATLGAEPIKVGTIHNARSIAWIPGRHELAFLSGDKNAVSQLFSVGVGNPKIRQHTHSEESVIKFQYAPDGSALAWLSQKHSQGEIDNSLASLFERMHGGDKGIVIDFENARPQHFVDPNASDYAVWSSTDLWVKRTGLDAYQAKTPGHVKRFYWSPNGSKLSVVYIGKNVPKKPFFSLFTSLGYYDITTKKFQALARARIPSDIDKSKQHYVGGVRFDGGEWIPGEDRLFVRRTTESVARKKQTTWASIDISNIHYADHEGIIWNEIEMYGGDPEPAFIPVNDQLVYSNKTLHARQFIYEVTRSGVAKAGILQGIEGSVSLVRFSDDFETAIFVNESLTRPPEIYIWRNGMGAEVLSHLNREIANKQMPTAKEVTWKSVDGVSVQGWLLVPNIEVSQGKPWPLVTFVHGGPGNVSSDKFDFYFALWPYPFKVYALNGIAVFIPNYRGTRSFGVEFATPEHFVTGPNDDILSGIESLISTGVVDPDRLGISGHSHGAWRGPLVVTQAKIFRAGSFAEGSQNQVLNYSLATSYVNRELHDVLLGKGASLYDDPQRYIDLSPELHFANLETAVLFEAGAWSNAIKMKGSPKAAARAGMAAEFVVYPKTGHNPRIPRIQKESAARNLDWFRFWLQGYKDPEPEKAEQYVRWRKMRDEQCERLKGEDTPSYCRH